MSRAQPSDPGAIARPDPPPDHPRPPPTRLGVERIWTWAGRLRGRRAARAALEAAADRLYRDLVARARAPAFFRELGVPDTPEGRFEMIGLHAALILLRLQREGAAGEALGQALFDLMFADLDQGLRELGVGDLGVGRQVKRLAGQFYARLRALDAAIQGGAAGRAPDGSAAERPLDGSAAERLTGRCCAAMSGAAGRSPAPPRSGRSRTT